MPKHPRARLHLEYLEARENPSGLAETFDAIVPPALPAGWAAWSNNDSAVSSTAAGKGVGGSVGLVLTGGSTTAGRAWSSEAQPADTGAASSVRLDSLIPAYVFARGTGLGSTTPSYLAAVVTRGVKLDLVEVTAGISRTIASVASPSSAYFSGTWARLSLVPTGNSVAVQLVRQDTGQYLNARGTWQSAATNAITATTTLAGVGSVGVGRVAQFAGPVAVDDFTVLPPAPLSPPTVVHQNFDTTAPGTVPAGWSSAAAGFQAATARAQSPANGFTSNGGSTTAARAWADAAMPADVDASAAVYLDSLIPAQVFARGSNLDTATPSYYAVTLTRGLNARLVKVVNGAETTLGTVKSVGYFSSQWLRVRLTAEGDQLRVVLYRADTKQWLTSEGAWSDSPDLALEVRDGSIAGGGKAGVARVAGYAGAITFDDFDAQPAGTATGPVVSLSRVSGSGAVTGDVTFRAAVTGTANRLEFRLDGQLRAVSATAPADWTFDSTTVVNGSHTLSVRAIDLAGNFGSAEFTFTVNNPDADPLPPPQIPRHYSYIRIAELAYSGNPMGTFEQNLLRDSVDVVIPNPRYLQTINATSPNTPQLIYSNVSNLYQGLLSDWLGYADQAGVSRELAFYHVTKATVFTGTSSSSQPVNWFWGAYQGSGAGTPTDVTGALRGGRSYNVNFGAAGQWTAIGYTDRFREINVTLNAPASGNWAGVWEYATAVDAKGNPTSWATLSLLADGTNNFRRSGTITFDPPADWKAASIGGGDRLMYVRFRVTVGEAAQAAELKTAFGRDYVRASGGYSGVIPAFDYAADKNGDGYLSDAEFASRQPGKDARFVYESRLFYPYYGQMRFVTNPSASAVRKWAADYHARLLDANPLADGIFMDNENGNLPFAGVSVIEPTATYSTDSGALIAAVSRTISPRWVLSNTSGGPTSADAVTAGSAAVFEEFPLRPLAANWSEVGDAANLIARRLATPGTPYVVIDSLPAGGSPTDPRTQLATLAYYYLVADPDRTMLMFYGGYSPSSTWAQHWSPAVAVDVGQPTGTMQVFASGTDPANAARTYKVFSRDYEKGLVLFKPLSYAQGQGEGTTGNNTATTTALNGNYRAVNADGSLGPVVGSVSLRNGEGAVFIKA